MQLIESKICVMISLGLGSMLVGLLPAWFSSHSRNHWPLLLSALLCMGAGVLLSTSLIHMLPEIREGLRGHEKYTELLFVCGFFLLYLTDEIVHFCKDKQQHALQHEHHQNYQEVANTSYAATRRGSSTNHKMSRSTNYYYGTMDDGSRQYEKYMNRQMPYNPNFGKAWSENDLTQDLTAPAPSQLCHVTHQEPCNVSPIGTFGLLTALSVHALLEGLAIGVEKSADKVLLMLGAVASHKLVVGFCLGIEIAATPTNTAFKHFISVVIFSFGSVAGIGLGMLTARTPTHIADTALPVLQALAGGTLLYVTMCEVLPRERARWHQQHDRKYAGIVQFSSVIFGFVCMTILVSYMED